MQVIAFIQAHAVVLSGVGVAVLDFLIEIIPAWKANTLVSLVLSVLQKKAAPTAPPSA